MHKRESSFSPLTEAIKSQYLLVAQESLVCHSVHYAATPPARRLAALPTHEAFSWKNSAHSLVLTMTYVGFF